MCKKLLRYSLSILLHYWPVITIGVFIQKNVLHYVLLCVSPARQGRGLPLEGVSLTDDTLNLSRLVQSALPTHLTSPQSAWGRVRRSSPAPEMVHLGESARLNCKKSEKRKWKKHDDDTGHWCSFLRSTVLKTLRTNMCDHTCNNDVTISITR